MSTVTGFATRRSSTVAAHDAQQLVDFMGRRFSHGWLYGEALKFTAGLQEVGIANGYRIGLYLPNVPIYPSAYYGAMIAGATVVNFSLLYTVEEFEAQVADSGTACGLSRHAPSPPVGAFVLTGPTKATT
jgi:long-chain acyl-CoA synthetase